MPAADFGFEMDTSRETNLSQGTFSYKYPEAAASDCSTRADDLSWPDSLDEYQEDISRAMLSYSRKERISYGPSMLRTGLSQCSVDGMVVEVAAGLPSLPSIPSRGFAECDAWGRKYCSGRRAAVLVALCALAPPAWLLVGAGYLDRVWGVVPRGYKIASFCLGGVTLVVAAVVAIVLATVR